MDERDGLVVAAFEDWNSTAARELAVLLDTRPTKTLGQMLAQIKASKQQIAVVKAARKEKTLTATSFVKTQSRAS